MSAEEMADKLKRWESLRKAKAGGRSDRKRDSPAADSSAGKRGRGQGGKAEKKKSKKQNKKRRT